MVHYNNFIEKNDSMLYFLYRLEWKLNNNMKLLEEELSQRRTWTSEIMEMFTWLQEMRLDIESSDTSQENWQVEKKVYFGVSKICC